MGVKEYLEIHQSSHILLHLEENSNCSGHVQVSQIALTQIAY